MQVKLMCTTDERKAQGKTDKDETIWSQVVGFSGTDFQGRPLEGQTEGVGNVSLNMTLTGPNVAMVKYGEIITIQVGE